MVFTLISYRNDVKMFKLNWKYEPQAIEWFYRKVLNVFTSFLWSMRIQTIEKEKKREIAQSL